MKSRSDLWLALLQECGELCSVSTTHDVNTVVRRVQSEGEQFFTLALPQFAKDLERALENGVILSDHFRGFRRGEVRVQVTHLDGSLSKVKKWHSGTPLFLGGFLDLIFDAQPEVTWDEYNELINAHENSQSPDYHPFMPRLRDPETDDEEVRMADAIRSIRQLALLFAKERSMCSEDKVDAAIQSYVDVDKELDRPFCGRRTMREFYSRVSATQRGSLI